MFIHNKFLNWKKNIIIFNYFKKINFFFQKKQKYCFQKENEKNIFIIDIETFLIKRFQYNIPIIDVRTSKEYLKGHIPSAYNISLFDDEMHSKIGTIYKQNGKESAMLLALDLLSNSSITFKNYTISRLRYIIEQTKEILKENRLNLTENKEILVHCLRGGMRSYSVGWLLSLFGFKVFLLQGGYKIFRQKVINLFNEKRNILLIGGKTGSGKTIILQELFKYQINLSYSYQVIDLEFLAKHMGSAFGSYKDIYHFQNNFFVSHQPTQEQFENDLAMRWGGYIYDNNNQNNLNNNNQNNNFQNNFVWMESESQRIGNIHIPNGIWKQMKESPIIYLNVPIEKRILHLTEQYSKISKEKLIEMVQRIQKKLGSQNATTIIQSIQKNNYYEACKLLLFHYYDKLYQKSFLERNEKLIHLIEIQDIQPYENVQKIFCWFINKANNLWN